MTTLLIFGAVGDLAGRYLLPALASLAASGNLPPELRVRGAGREDLDRDSFRAHAGEQLDQHAGDVPPDTRDTVLDRLDYVVADVTDPSAVASALRGTTPLRVYLALPPALFEPTVRALAEAGLPRDALVVVEKPFGTDLEGARRLNRLLAEVTDEDHIFRVDHFLAKQTVQNILGLRFANRIFEPVWNARHIESIDITWDETLALEGRASYYDTAGALRDMLQNHLLQLLCLVAMEPPHTLGARDLRERKADVLRAVRTPTAAQTARDTVRARYTAGRAGNRDVVDYTAERGVDPDRGTETFAAMTCWIDNWRWAGVPFRLRSGKALGAARSEIAIRFRDVPHLVFGQGHEPEPNVLRMVLDPDRVELSLNLNGAGDPFDLEPACLGTDLAAQELPAYARLLLDVLDGDTTLSVGGAEAEEAWRIVDPVLATWSTETPPLLEYPAGSSGPSAKT
ncbi:glucose-6-phosphate dehydrogenase [Actinokineospora iranica]|uniref:Glucose-6-phosphate 1-dehydrogenase n=1 Tax=Actinokineospora iranica TaxID=1271860 RepID=A0A1G6YG73_9PSEU|nr:glucose-6-phosphate dehydrogenase [Actinokineospora iranica]SDD89409.1 glucose-6-phosphate 1-dehydrogenase [Actinokineospora iranica]